MSTDKIEALDQPLAGIFSEPQPISTETEPSLPDFDHAALAGIFSEPLPIFSNSEPSPPRFDHQALAEIFGEPLPVLTNPQPPPLSMDGESSPPLFGEIHSGEPAASIVAVPPSTNAESARPQRAESLLAKIRCIFSPKAETLPSSPENGSPSASPAGQLHELEPVAKD